VFCFGDVRPSSTGLRLRWTVVVVHDTTKNEKSYCWAVVGWGLTIAAESQLTPESSATAVIIVTTSAILAGSAVVKEFSDFAKSNSCSCPAPKKGDQSGDIRLFGL